MAGERRSRRGLVAIAVVALLVAGAVMAAAPATAVLSAPYTYAYVEAPQSALVLESGTVQDFGSSTSTAALSVGSPAQWFLSFVAPTGSLLQPGTYAGVGVTATAANAGFSLTGALPCSSGTGQFTVDDIASNGGGGLLSFSARFEFDCAGVPASGAVSFNSTADYRVHRISRTWVDFGNVTTGSTSSPKPVTLRNDGPSDLHIGSITKGGADPGEFAMTTTCGALLHAGESCAITLKFRPTASGYKSATLSIVDGVSPSGDDVFLGGFGAVAATRTLKLNVGQFKFGNQRVGTYGAAHAVQLRNTGNHTLRIDALFLSGKNAYEFFGGTTCRPTLAAGKSCLIIMFFSPTGRGWRHAQVVVRSNATNGTVRSVALGGSGTLGYYLARTNGRIGAFGDAVPYGSPGAMPAPIVGMATTPVGDGYWLVGRDGSVYRAGDAGAHGWLRGVYLNRPIVGMAATSTGKGYWLVASDGGIFSFGDAKFRGSTGAIALNKPIVGMTSTVTGKGYWLVASDGGIFAFGDATFFGSTGAMRLNQPIVGMTVTPSGRGYWLVASDGGIFSFGDAHFYGSTGAMSLVSPIVGMQPAPDGRGYWFVARDGGLFSFGPGVAFYGSLGGRGIDDVVAMAGTAPPLSWLHATSKPAAASVQRPATVWRLGTRHGIRAR